MNLKEFVNNMYSYGKTDDKQIIMEFIMSSQLESEFLELIPKLAKSQMDRKEAILARHTWLEFPTDYFWKHYKKDDAIMLDQMQRLFILYGKGCYNEKSLNKLKERIPELECPTVIFHDCLTYLHELGIYFKNDEQKDLTYYNNW